MYAGEPDTFNPKEIELLGEMANDLAYGIGALRHRAERKRAEEALRAEERRYQTLAEISPVGIFRDGRAGANHLCQSTLVPDYRIVRQGRAGRRLVARGASAGSGAGCSGLA